MPPDYVDILDPTSPRFNCAGRFLGAARDIGVSAPTLTTVLNQRNGSLHRYWKIGMTSGSTDESQWPLMHDGRFVSIGWHEYVPDLSQTIAENRSDVKQRIRDWLLLPGQPTPVWRHGKLGKSCTSRTQCPRMISYWQLKGRKLVA